MHNKTLYFFAFALILSSCETMLEDWSLVPEIRAGFEPQPETKTSLAVDGSGIGTIYWTPHDQIDVFFGTARARYTSQNSEDAATAIFKTSDSISSDGFSSTNIWGLYPSNKSSGCDGNSVTTVLPSKQYGVPETFDDDLFMAVAHSTSTNLQFYNVCGGIKFSLLYDDIVSVSLKGNNDEDLAGDISVSFQNGVPKATVVNGAKEITLIPKKGDAFAKGVDYYFTVLPIVLSSGFTMSFTAKDGTVGVFNYTDKSVTINRSAFRKKTNLDLYASFEDDRQPNNVIYYTSSSGRTVSPNNSNVFGANLISNVYAGGRGILTFDGDVTSIGQYAFGYCSTLTSITIPSSVTSIGQYAFIDCTKLTSISIPSNVTSIEKRAFYSCSGLDSIIVEPGNPNYDSRNNCNAIIETSTNSLILGCYNTVIPSSVSDIGGYAFYQCIGLTSIVIPDSVTNIGNYAFYQCTGLTSVTIPQCVTSIGYCAFRSCSGLASIVVDSGNPCYDSRNNCNAIIQTSDNRLIVGCKNTIIPSSVTRVENYAFENCSGLSAITIPEGITNISGYMFYGCSNLVSITIPSSVRSISSNAFNACPVLASIIVDSSNPYFDSRDNCNAIIETSTNRLILGCKDTFVPIGVTSIGDYAFQSCSSLTSITLPNGLTSIGERAFSGCSGLTSITIPSGVTSIGNYAFYNCYGLTSVTLPSGLISIGSSAFQYCSKLTSITVKAMTPPAGGSNIFANTNNCPIYVPSGSVSVYKSTTFWRDYADRIQAIQ